MMSGWIVPMPWGRPAWVLSIPHLQELDRKRRRIGVRHDLIIVAMHDERRHVNLLQVLSEVGLREGLDAIVVRLGTSHHSLTPPVVDDTLTYLRARTVEAVEGASGHVAIELRAVGDQRGTEAVEDLERQACCRHPQCFRPAILASGTTPTNTSGHVERSLAGR
jgi:hypothetical protein